MKRRRRIAGRIGRALKALFMRFSGRGGSPDGWPSSSWPLATLPGSAFDYEKEAGEPWLNGAVSICLGWIADNFPEPALRVTRRGAEGVAEPVVEHPLARLLEDPNPYYDGDALWAATAISYSAHGNAYWVKARAAEGSGRPVELWYLPHWQVRPTWPSDGREFISGYEYVVDGRTRRLRREDVVHFRFGVDPANMRLGLSRLRPVLREVFTDNEASTFMAALIRNMGVPGVMISPYDYHSDMHPEAAAALRKEWRAQFTGEGRGEPLVPPHAMRVEKISFTPEEVGLYRARLLPESRICGALRIPAMVVGLVVGNETRTYANYAEARRAAYEDCLIPMQRRFARTLQRQLLPDLGDPRRETVGWDYSGVAALRDDMSEVYRRNSVAVAGGWMTVDEARAAVGLGPR